MVARLGPLAPPDDAGAAREAWRVRTPGHDSRNLQRGPTARPQILERDWNPEYHAVIRDFERRTGTGAVLNTSFNLHGEPVVASAADAVDTFERSGLPHVAIGHWLISKK